MKLLMVGAGGVGGYFGGRLAAAGEDVRFIARGAHLAAMQENGLRIESDLGDAVIHPVDAGEGVGDWGPADVVFIAVKLGDTASAIEACRQAVGPETVAISLQNGLVGEDMLIDAFGADRVAGGAAYIAAVVESPGVIRHTGTNQRIRLGELTGGKSARMDRIVEALTAAGIDAENMADITRTIWEKFVFLAAFAGVTCLTGETVGVFRADPDMRALFRAAMAEIIAVGRARGVDLAEDYADQSLTFADTLPDSMTSSMYHDLVAGKPLEVDWLSGAVARMGAELGVDTPVNATIYAALKPRKDGAAGDS